MHVGARQDRQANDVGVFLEGATDDLLRRLTQTGVDHLHTRVTQRACNDLGTAVVTVQPRLCNENSDLVAHLGW